MIGYAVLWGLVGWCGTPYPGWWLWYIIHHLKPPPPDGDPWLIYKVIGIIGGLAGGWVFQQVWSAGPEVSAIGAATSAVGALVGSVVFNDIAALIMGRQMLTGQQRKRA